MLPEKLLAGESAGQTDQTIEPCIDENAVQPTVQNSDKASDRSSPWKFSRQMVNFPEKLSSGATFGARKQAESLHLPRNLRRGYSGRNLWNPCSKLYSGRGLLNSTENVSCLKGRCIHHDNGLLLVHCAYEFAEHHKISILLDAGYNAIRSGHNPCSKASFVPVTKWECL